MCPADGSATSVVFTQWSLLRNISLHLTSFRDLCAFARVSPLCAEVVRVAREDKWRMRIKHTSW